MGSGLMYVDPLLLFCKCIYVAAMRQKGNSMNFMNNNTNGRMFGITSKSINPIFNTKGGCSMTDNEKKLLQAKHRLEEAQMRDRQKERKARTRRLIQEGAVLEKVYPAAADMDLTKLEDFLYWALR